MTQKVSCNRAWILGLFQLWWLGLPLLELISIFVYAVGVLSTDNDLYILVALALHCHCGTMVKDNVGTSEASWSRLSDEIGEHMLSLSSMPALCRCRSVCRKWNTLLRKPQFLDLCDLNGRINQEHLCATHHKTSPEIVSGWQCLLANDVLPWPNWEAVVLNFNRCISARPYEG